MTETPPGPVAPVRPRAAMSSRPERPRIGFALGSGGARGWCHLGAIRALADLGLVPDVVSGCSMGALVGAACAAGRLDALEAWAGSLTATGVLGYIDMRIGGGGLMDGQELGGLLADLGLPDRIEDLALPFGTVATDLATGDEVRFTDGDLLSAVRASLSVPGLFRPQPVGSRLLLDGALVDPVPVALAAHLGAEVIIAIDPNATCGRPFWTPQAPTAPAQTIFARLMQFQMLPAALRSWMAPSPPAAPEVTSDSAEGQGPPPGYFEVVGTAIDIMQVKVLEGRLHAHPPDILLEADLKEIGILELQKAQQAIDHGRAMVEARADDLRKIAESVAV